MFGKNTRKLKKSQESLERGNCVENFVCVFLILVLFWRSPRCENQNKYSSTTPAMPVKNFFIFYLIFFKEVEENFKRVN